MATVRLINPWTLLDPSMISHNPPLVTPRSAPGCPERADHLVQVDLRTAPWLTGRMRFIRPWSNLDPPLLPGETWPSGTGWSPDSAVTNWVQLRSGVWTAYVRGIIHRLIRMRHISLLSRKWEVNWEDQGSIKVNLETKNRIWKAVAKSNLIHEK